MTSANESPPSPPAESLVEPPDEPPGERSARARTNWRRLAILVVAVYVVFAVAVYVGADRLIFLPGEPSYDAGPGVTMIPTGDGEQIATMAHETKGAEFTVLYFHGNAEDLGNAPARLTTFQSLGLSTFAIDYRGYGRSDGSASEDNAYEDADAAYDYLTDTLGVAPDHIIVVGRSMGGAVAIDLASRREVAGVMVESTFTTAYRVAVPFPILPFDQMESIDKIGDIHVPIAVLHGDADEVIPYDHGRELFAAANEPKLSLWVKGAGHLDLLEASNGRYETTLRDLVDLIEQ